MNVDGALREARGFGDFQNAHLLHEAKEENRPLADRQILRRFPDGLNLIVDHGPGLRRDFPVRQPVPDLSGFNGRLLNLTPELEPPVPQIPSDRIVRNPHQPRVQRRIAAKRVPAPVGIPEAVLREGFGHVPVAHGSQHKPKYPGPVELHDAVEVLNLRNRALHARGNEPGSDCGLHTTV